MINKCIQIQPDPVFSAEIDDRLTRELLQAIDQEPKLKLVGPATAGLKLKTDRSS